MTDIVERLLNPNAHYAGEVATKAADEIKQLRERIRRLEFPSRDCYHIEACPHWVEVIQERNLLRAQVEQLAWRPIGTAPSGERILLCWDAFGGIKAHVELGRRAAEGIYTNTYGKPFSGVPNRWMPLPSTESNHASRER